MPTAGVAAQDSPDWIPLQQQAAPLLLNLSQTAEVVPGVSGWLYVGNASHLIANMSSGPGIALTKAVFTFANDNLGTAATHKVTAWCDNTHQTRAIVPVMGNWMQVATSGGGVGSGQACALYIEGVSYVPRPGLVADPADGIHSSTLAVGAGAVITLDLPRCTPGLWQYTVSSGGTGLVVEVDQEFATGVWLGVSRQVNAAATTLSATFGLVAAPARMLIQNASAGAADLLYTVQAIG